MIPGKETSVHENVFSLRHETVFMEASSVRTLAGWESFDMYGIGGGFLF